MSETDIVHVMRARGESGDAECAAAAAEIVRLRRIAESSGRTERRAKSLKEARAALNPKMRVRTHGLPFHMKVKARTVTDEATGCWIWQGACCNGYGKLRLGPNGKPVACHRLMYEHVHGPIPPGGVVMHKCDNRRCVNPDHLSVGTQKENIRDMHKKGRCGRNVLTVDEVREIRRLHATGIGIARLAAMHDVGNYTIQSILSGRTWSWV